MDGIFSRKYFLLPFKLGTRSFFSIDMINDLFFPSLFICIRYNALVLCLLPLPNSNDRSKELSLSTASTSRDRAIECLKRAGIDNYKVSVT